MKLRAHAKINIGLHILGKRTDGYHDLETVFHEINMFDEIELEPHDRLMMTADSILVPIDETNLCLRAAQLLQSELKVQQGVMINLKKNIPIGAGLGGGSSDAAAVLVGLNKLWGLKLKNNRLRKIATEIGSDIPFFVEGGTAYATGRGEILQHFDLDIPFWIVLVTPPRHVSTAWAYQSLKSDRQGKAVDLRTALTEQIQEPKKLAAIVQNDFEPSVFEAHPEILQTKEKLTECGALFSLMTGSGSSVFGFFADADSAQRSIKEFPQAFAASITEPHFRGRQNSE
jgi:4-diphosphocytidyl-2-C-methyl-D-erythritol kinase